MDTDALARENAVLKARLAEVEAVLAEVQEANRRLEDILRTAQREKFGKRSEKLSPDQFNLPLEDARRRFVKRFENERSPIDERALPLGPLARPDHIPQRRHTRDGYQPGREPDPPDRPHEKKCTLREK